MDVAIAGAHGKIGRRLTRLLAARGDHVQGIFRNEDHYGDVRSDGGEPLIVDLEHVTADELAPLIEGADAVVFAAGAGPGSGPGRKVSMDRDGAITLLEAAIQAEVPRYVIVSSMGAEDPPQGEDTFSVYLRAKAEADQAVMESDRGWTVLRPGRLTDAPGTGLVSLAREVGRGEVTRADVAAVLVALLDEPRSAGRVLALTNGPVPVAEALSSALQSGV